MHRSHGQGLNDLADRLVLEYAGAVGAAEIRSTVLLADRSVPGDVSPSEAERMLLCESIARRVLTDRLASDSSAHLAAVPTWSATHALAS